MPTIVSSTLKSALRKPGDPLNVLTYAVHESYQTSMSGTNCHYFLFRGPGLKDWNATFRPLPPNFTLLDPNKGEKQIPRDVVFDVVLSQNRLGVPASQFTIAEGLARSLHIPHVALEHTLPHPKWSVGQVRRLREMRADVNVFIGDYQRDAWGWHESESVVIEHGIDTDLFVPPDDTVTRRPVLLSVVNDWVKRDWCQPAGQKLWTTLGLIPVEDVKIGHMLLSDDGRIHPVVRTFKRDYFGDLVKICLNNKSEVMFTPDHAIRVYRGNQWQYVESSRVRVGDILKYPRHRQEDFTFDNVDFAWLIGLIVGDGSISRSGTISICLHEDEIIIAEAARRLLETWVGHANISTRPRRRGHKAIRIEATSMDLGKWLSTSIGKRREKRLPEWIMRGSDQVRSSALAGLWAADGSFKNGVGKGRQPRASFATISPRLAGQVNHLLHSYGVSCTTKRVKRTTNKSSGKEVPIYRVNATGKDNFQRCRDLTVGLLRGDPYSYTVVDVDLIPEWSGEVYNCEVQDDPSYVVYPGFVAHNCCGFEFWRSATEGLPVFAVGDTPGLSRPARTVRELAWYYQTSRIFVNTSQVSPVPTSLLEAMACGCAVVSTDTCMIPGIIEDGVNGYLTNDPGRFRDICERLLADPEECGRLGRGARDTVVGRFGLGRFVSSWDHLLEGAASIIPFART